jgi:hypothetical protein
MRKLGMVVLVVCLLGTVPVAAAEGQGGVGRGGGGWGLGVVEWVAAFIAEITQDMGPNVEPDGLAQSEADESESEMGPNVEPDGLAHGQPTQGSSTV